MKQTLLSLLLLLLPVAASADANGTCGENLTWTFESATGTLTISGTGQMAKYGLSNPAPWYNFRFDILKVIFESGVTSIDDCAFFDCSNLTSISIPDGMTEINFGAFQDCNELININIPKSVTWLGVGVFLLCI